MADKELQVTNSKSDDSKEKTRVDRWKARISDANKAFNKWYQEFQVSKCKRYQRGKQRIGNDEFDVNGDQRVVINLIAPTIAIKLPGLYYYYPYIRILGTPAIASLDQSSIEDRAQLLADTGNTIIRDPATGFRRETLMAVKQAMWAFGVIEIGYSPHFIENPYFKRPALVEDSATKDEVDDGDAAEAPAEDSDPSRKEPLGMADDDLAQLKQLVDKEQFYVRHIPPETFRVSISGNPHLQSNDWCGYYEWEYIEDIKASAAYDKEATKDLESGGSVIEDYAASRGDVSTSSSAATPLPADSQFQDRDRDRSGQMKVWKIWDMRQRCRYVFAEGCNRFFIDGKPYNDLPLFPIAFDVQDDDWYPVPPITAMLIPQDEYNDSREMLRGIRKTIHPRYMADNGIDPEELHKLEMGGPGVIARVNTTNPPPVIPVTQPTLSEGIVRTIQASKEELMQVSGVSGEARGQADSETATQASIINQRSMIRDSFSRLQVAEWLGQITRGLIQLAIDNMSLPMWILRNCDPQSSNFMNDAQRVSELYREITYTDLKEADQLLRWDVSVDVETLSPLTEDSMRAQITTMVTTLAQPPIANLLHNSPPLLKTFLDRNGIRSSKDQDSIRMALGMVATMQQGSPSQAAGGGGGGGMPIAPNPAGGPGMGPVQQLVPGTQGMPMPGPQVASPNAPSLPLANASAGPGPQ